MRITIRVSSRESLSVVPSRGAHTLVPSFPNPDPLITDSFSPRGCHYFFCLSWFVSWELGLVTTSLEESQSWLDKKCVLNSTCSEGLTKLLPALREITYVFFFFLSAILGRVSEFWKSNIFWTLFGDTFLAHGFSILPEIISFCPCWKLTRYLKGFFKK